MDRETRKLLVSNEVFVDMEPTGSRVIVSPMPEGRDEDWIVLATHLPTAVAVLKGYGFTLDGGNDSMYGSEEFQSTRKGDLNLIVTALPHVFERYVLATDLAKKLNLTSKVDRIKLFKTIREVGVVPPTPSETIMVSDGYFQHRDWGY